MYITKLLSKLVTIVAWMTGVESSGSCNSSRFELKSGSYSNKRSLGHTLGYFHGGFVECVKECMFLTRCQSISLQSFNFSCELHTTDSLSSSPIPEKGWSYSDRTGWPKVMFGECADKPCTANQRCVPSKPYTCLTEVYELACDNHGDCSDINGVCTNNKCVCPTNFQYSIFARKCYDYTTM